MRQNPTIFREDREESKRMHKITRMSEKIQDPAKYEKNTKESNQNFEKTVEEESGQILRRFKRIRQNPKESERKPKNREKATQSYRIQENSREFERTQPNPKEHK